MDFLKVRFFRVYLNFVVSLYEVVVLLDAENQMNTNNLNRKYINKFDISIPAKSLLKYI